MKKKKKSRGSTDDCQKKVREGKYIVKVLGIRNPTIITGKITTLCGVIIYPEFAYGGKILSRCA